MSVADLPAKFDQNDMIEAIGPLNRPTANALDHQTRYLVQPFDAASQLGFVSKGLLVSLQAQGFQVFMPPDPLADLQYGNWRVATPDRVDALLSVVDTAEPGWQPPPNSRVVASYDPLSSADRARSMELEAKIRAAMGPHPPGRIFAFSGWGRILAEGAGLARPEIDELAALQKRGDGFAVYLSPAP
jgi:hypothetical protein